MNEQASSDSNDSDRREWVGGPGVAGKQEGGGYSATPFIFAHGSSVFAIMRSEGGGGSGEPP